MTKYKLMLAALALLMTSGMAQAQSHDAITQRHLRIKNALTVAPYPGGPTIGACQVAMIEAVGQLGEARKEEARTRGGDFTQAEWQVGMDALNQLGERKTSYSFTQAECIDIINKEADIENLLRQDREREQRQ